MLVQAQPRHLLELWPQGQAQVNPVELSGKGAQHPPPAPPPPGDPLPPQEACGASILTTLLASK